MHRLKAITLDWQVRKGNAWKDNHIWKKKKTTKAWHFISRINYTLLAMGQKFQGLLNDFLAST